MHTSILIVSSYIICILARHHSVRAAHCPDGDGPESAGQRLRQGQIWPQAQPQQPPGVPHHPPEWAPWDICGSDLCRSQGVGATAQQILHSRAKQLKECIILWKNCVHISWDELKVHKHELFKTFLGNLCRVSIVPRACLKNMFYFLICQNIKNFATSLLTQSMWKAFLIIYIVVPKHSWGCSLCSKWMFPVTDKFLLVILEMMFFWQIYILVNAE